MRPSASPSPRDGPAPAPGDQGCRAAWDVIFLAGVLALSAVLYAPRLGFYSDDWSFLGYLAVNPDQSLTGLYQLMMSFPDVASRPTHAFYFALLYWLFGPSPLGYHLVNAVVFSLGVLLFHAVLRELRVPRAVALTVPIVYALLPTYSVTRFWVATFQANLSMALCGLSLHADLRAASARFHWGWKLLAVAALAASVMGFEVFVPLFALSPWLVWMHVRREATAGGPAVGRMRAALLPQALNGAVLVALAVFKLITTARLGVEPSRGLAVHVYLTGWLAGQAVLVHFVELGVRLPIVVGRIFLRDPGSLAVLVAALIGVLVFVRLAAMHGRAGGTLPAARYFTGLLGIGLVVFALGYAVFLGNYMLTFTATGIGSRNNIAAAAGMAFVWTGGAGLVSHLVRDGRRRVAVFAVLVALLTASGSLALTTLADFWITAYGRAQGILTDIATRFPGPAPWKTLLLDGVCPYEGPAIVFESSWDLQGALLMRYADYALRADVVSPRLEIGDDGLQTSIYGSRQRHAYDGLFVYHFPTRRLQALPDAATARRYFEYVSPDLGRSCPPGEPGRGVRVF